LDLEANCQSLEGKIEDNHENGREYVGITETPYWNLMLDKRVLRTKERLTTHRSLLPQEMVRCEVCITGLLRKHNYIR
jgi:hypothetical protein